MKSFRQFIIENKVSDLNVPTGKDAKGFDWTALQRQIRKYKEKLGKSISQTEIDRLIKSRRLPEKEVQANVQGKFDAQSEWPSSFDNEDPTDPWFDDDPKKKRKLKNTTTVRTKGKPFGKPSGIDPNIGKAKYVPPKDVPKGETGRRAKRRTWDYEKVQRDIDRADAKRARLGTGEYKPERVNQGDVSKRARKYTQKIKNIKIEKEANKVIEKLRRIRKNEKSGLTSRISTAYDTRKRNLKSKADEILKSINKDSKSSSTFKYKSPPTVNPDLGKSKVRQSVKGPGSSTGSLSRANLRFSGDANYQQLKKTIDPVKTKTVNPQKTYNQFQKDISRIRGKKSNFTKANLLHQVTKVTKKVPKVGADPFAFASEFARQRDKKNATTKRQIAGGTVNALSSYYGFKTGASTAAKIASPLLAAPFPGARPLYGLTVLGGGIGGHVLSTTATQTAFDQLAGKKGTRVATQTQTQKEKTKNKTKVLTQTQNKNKGIILPPGGKKKEKPVYFALNPAKVSK